MSISTLITAKSPRSKKYFRLLDKSSQSTLVQNQNDSLKATLSLVKKHKYLYLDMNSTNGFKAMQQDSNPQSDDQDQKFGPYIVCQGSKTSKQKVKLKQFMTINYKTRQRRNSLRSRVKQQLDKSRQKFDPYFSDPIKKQRQKIRLFRGMQNQKYQSIKNKIETEQINENILKRQQLMMQKLGIVADFQSINDKNTPSVKDKTKKKQEYFLPKILKSY